MVAPLVDPPNPHGQRQIHQPHTENTPHTRIGLHAMETWRSECQRRACIHSIGDCRGDATRCAHPPTNRSTAWGWLVAVCVHSLAILSRPDCCLHADLRCMAVALCLSDADRRPAVAATTAAHCPSTCTHTSFALRLTCNSSIAKAHVATAAIHDPTLTFVPLSIRSLPPSRTQPPFPSRRAAPLRSPLPWIAVGVNMVRGVICHLDLA